MSKHNVAVGLLMTFFVAAVHHAPSFAAQPRVDCYSFTDWTEVDFIGDDHFHQKTGGPNPNETYPTGEFFEERQVNANGLGHTNLLEDWTIESNEHETCTP